MILNINSYYFCTMTNECTIISHISHCCMFRHYRVIIRDFVSYTIILLNAAVTNTIIVKIFQIDGAGIAQSV